MQSLRLKHVRALGTTDHELERVLTATLDSWAWKNDNYIPRRLDLNGHLVYSILVNESDEIVSGCGIYNGGRYPSGVYRILNRSFINPAFRRKGVFTPINTQHVLPQQIDLCRNELKTIFLSREGKNTQRFLKWWLIRYGASISPNWQIPEGYVHVAPKSTTRPGYQKVAYCHLEAQSCWNPKTITEMEWTALNS